MKCKLNQLILMLVENRIMKHLKVVHV